MLIVNSIIHECNWVAIEMQFTIMIFYIRTESNKMFTTRNIRHKVYLQN